MARHEANRGAACYHSFVAILLLLLGGGLLGLGIWLRVSEHGGPTGLSYAGTGLPNVMFWAGVLAICVGVFLLATAMAALFALSRKCVGKVFRVVYIAMALVILAALVLISVVCFVILANREASVVRDALGEAWKETVRENPPAICAIEEALSCRSFDSTCAQEKCASCPGDPAKLLNRPPCFGEIAKDLRNVYLPLGIVSALVAITVLIDLFVTCAL